MLKLAVESDKARIDAFCSKIPLGARISCNMAAYGLEFDFFNVWYGEDGGILNSVVGSFCGVLTVCVADNANYSEIADFLSMCNYSSLCAEKETLNKLSFPSGTDKRMFVYKGGSSAPTAEPCPQDLLKAAYSLIARSIPNAFAEDEQSYLAWLSDFTFRQRRSLARIKAICSDDTVLSCALTAAESETAAIISGVACDASTRGAGLGKKTVLSLANELLSEGKKVYVIALNDGAGAFYEKIGFEPCGTVSYTEKE